jgi:hypothetical protein
MELTTSGEGLERVATMLEARRAELAEESLRVIRPRSRHTP